MFNDLPGTAAVSFTSPQPVTIGDITVFPGTKVIRLDSSGNLSTSLPATDDPSLNIQGWQYRVRELWPGGRLFYLSVPIASVSIDLVSVAPQPNPATGQIFTQGEPGFTRLAASFVQPANNNSANVIVASTAWMAVGSVVYMETAGYYAVTAVVDPITVTLTNLGYSVNAGSGTTIEPGGIINSAGIAGTTALVSGTGDAFFHFYQPSASNSWLITHNLNKYPSVSVVDSAGNQGIGSVQYLTSNTLSVSFSSAFSGDAYLN